MKWQVLIVRKYVGEKFIYNSVEKSHLLVKEMHKMKKLLLLCFSEFLF